MSPSLRTRAVSGAVALLLSALGSNVALGAENLKPGLWEARVMSTGPGAAPVVRERFAGGRRLGIRPTQDGGFIFRHCVVADQLQSRELPRSVREPSCTFSNLKREGNTFTADEQCQGIVRGTGHVSTTFDSDTRYTTRREFWGVRLGRGRANVATDITGTWIGADCSRL